MRRQAVVLKRLSSMAEGSGCAASLIRTAYLDMAVSGLAKKLGVNHLLRMKSAYLPQALTSRPSALASR
jgi:hypothetical protein